MAKTQTRRSVSFNRDLYERIAAAAEAAEISIAKYVEGAVLARFESEAGSHLLGEMIAKLEAKANPEPDPEPATPTDLVLPDLLAGRVGVLPRTAEAFDALLARSSIGRGLANIKQNGIEAELEDLADEMGGVRVEYDEP